MRGDRMDASLRQSSAASACPQMSLSRKSGDCVQDTCLRQTEALDNLHFRGF